MEISCTDCGFLWAGDGGEKSSGFRVLGVSKTIPTPPLPLSQEVRRLCEQIRGKHCQSSSPALCTVSLPKDTSTARDFISGFVAIRLAASQSEKSFSLNSRSSVEAFTLKSHYKGMKPKGLRNHWDQMQPSSVSQKTKPDMEVMRG